MTALESILNTYRENSQTEREKGSYFEELICTYLRNEPTYKDLYASVWPYSDWTKYQPKKEIVFKPQKTLREHQVNALDSVESGLKLADRGKLIMACGTGKTFTGLKIAEKLAGANKRVLFLVLSLSLLSQTLFEWTQETQTPLHSFAVCSDSD